MGHIDWAIVAGIVAAAVEASLHYFPWRRILGRTLPRIPSYVLGTTGWLVPFVAWALATGNVVAAKGVVVVAVFSGLSVLGCYALDSHLDRRAEEKVNEDYRRAIYGGPQDSLD